VGVVGMLMLVLLRQVTSSKADRACLDKLKEGCFGS
jgi:hypothetical protein